VAVAVLIAAVLVIVLVTVIALSRFGVIDGGPFAHKVPKVSAPTEWPATVGEMRLAGNSKPDVSPLDSLDFDWEVSGRYSTGEGEDRVVHSVRVFGSTDRVKDTIGNYGVQEVEEGYCGSSILGSRFLTRQCGVTRGSIVAVVESPPSGPSDEQLIGYATSLANALTQVR
jgi:hypothetical protein